MSDHHDARSVNRLKAFADTYPEAAGYLLNFSEVYVPQTCVRE